MSTKSTATFPQAAHLLTLFGQKDVSKEQFGQLVDLGLLSDLLDSDPTKVDRDKFRDVLGLKITVTPVAELVSSIITVDRSVCPSYPDWVTKVIYPQFVGMGPVGYDVTTLKQWLHDDQKSGVVAGNLIHEYLKSNKMLEGCLGLRDLEEIQKKGIAFFRKYFQGKAVFGWKSVVRDSNGDLRVPCLVEDGGEVLLNWRWLVFDWFSNNPALRFV
ncbi:TPA: hypothetical protein DEP94_02490 [Candidatus Nomurabacteria bacterium]|nr:hypothetical protein [Candidatus Nomurabacteria bacterium]